MSAQERIWKSDIMKNTILIGCGGSGYKIVNTLKNRSNIDIFTINTDEKNSPSNISMAPESVEGCKGDHILAWALTKDFENEIKERLSEYKSVIITAGLGGGTATGSMPPICSYAKELGAKTVSLVSIPMSFEDVRRKKALNTLTKLEKISDCVIVLDMDSLTSIVPNMNFDTVIETTDKIMCKTAVRLEELMKGPFFSYLPAIYYTFAYGKSNDPLTAVKNAKMAPLFSDTKMGKVLIHLDSKVSREDRDDIVDYLANTYGVVPELVSGSEEKEITEAILFIPISTLQVY